jgi:hypothetical protein
VKNPKSVTLNTTLGAIKIALFAAQTPRVRSSQIPACYLTSSQRNHWTD